MAKPKKKEDQPIKLNMTFEDALKKALNTPIPKKKITSTKNKKSQ
jgi:transcriptional/translational regulatory protein YebC/TACO1